MTKRPGIYREKATDMLSALFLLLAVLLAGGYGPLTAQVPLVADSSKPSPTRLGTGNHRSAPGISKQQHLLSEVKDAKTSIWDDGKPKHYLAAQGLELPQLSGGDEHAHKATLPNVVVSASPYSARAPPVFPDPV